MRIAILLACLFGPLSGCASGHRCCAAVGWFTLEALENGAEVDKTRRAELYDDTQEGRQKLIPGSAPPSS